MREVGRKGGKNDHGREKRGKKKKKKKTVLPVFFLNYPVIIFLHLWY